MGLRPSCDRDSQQAPMSRAARGCERNCGANMDGNHVLDTADRGESKAMINISPQSTGALPLRREPYNIEAEQALLGAILINNDAFERVSDQLEAGHFYDPLHARIFETAAHLIANGRSATPVTLKTYFENEESIGAVSIPQYLGRLAVHATSVINARDYARTIRDLAIRRSLIIIGEEMVNAAYDSPADLPAAQQIEDAEQQLFQLGEHGSAAHECDVGTALDGALEMIAAAYERDGGLAGLPTGFADLDRHLGGLAPSDLIILAGRPSQGKTALATNIAFNVAQWLADEHARERGLFHDGEPPKRGEVSFYSLEMSAEQLVMRQLSQVVGIPSERLRRGDLSESEYRRCTADGRNMLAKLPLHIDATGGLTIPQLMTRARRRKRLKDTRLIVVDYLQLMAAGGRAQTNKNQEVTQISNALKALAKELNVPVLALSQLSRQVESREDKRPKLSDLRESGSIEQDADVVMFVFREEYYIKRQEPSTTKFDEHQKWEAELEQAAGIADLIIGKHRHGPVGTVRMAFSEEFTMFSNLAKIGY